MKGPAVHSRLGCKLKKMGLTSVEAKKLVANTQAQLQREAEEAAEQATSLIPEVEQTEEVELHQPVNQFFTLEVEVPNTDASTITLLDQMLSLETQTSRLSTAFGPLPDNEFIMTNQPVQRPSALTACTKAGKAAAAKKREASTTAPWARAGSSKKLPIHGGDKGEYGTDGVNQRDMA